MMASLQPRKLFTEDGIEHWLGDYQWGKYQKYTDTVDNDLECDMDIMDLEYSDYDVSSVISKDIKPGFLKYCAMKIQENNGETHNIPEVLELMEAVLKSCDRALALTTFTWFSKHFEGHKFRAVPVQDIMILRLAIVFGLQVDVPAVLKHAVDEEDMRILSSVRIMSQIRNRNFEMDLSEALQYAITSGKPKSAGFLLEHNSFQQVITRRDDRGNNILHFFATVMKKRRTMLRILSRMFALRPEHCCQLLEKTNNSGLNPFQCALSNNFYDFADLALALFESTGVDPFETNPFNVDAEQSNQLLQRGEALVQRIGKIAEFFQNRGPRTALRDLSNGKELHFIPVEFPNGAPELPEFEYITTVVGIPEPTEYDLSQGCYCSIRCGYYPPERCDRELLLEECIAANSESNNYHFHTECSWACSCVWECKIRRKQQRGLRSKIKLCYDSDTNWGVYCNDPNGIEENVSLGEYAGERMNPDEEDPNNHYIFSAEIRGIKYSVNAKHKGNFTRFINHGCTPNVKVDICFWDCCPEPFPHFVFCTLKRIDYGEQLVIDYGEQFWAEAGFPCKCNTSYCRAVWAIYRI